MDIPARLLEERKRLCLTQSELADRVGTTKRSVINWESGASNPAADALAQYAAAGADVLYILTGQRSAPVAPQALLPESDRILLDHFHAAPAGVQVGVKTTLEVFAPPGRSKRGKAA